jgi:amidase
MDPSFLSATALADMVRTRRIGALELLDHYIGRTEKLDSRINAIVVRDFERARARARDLDSQADKSAPLFGVPMTVKESFDVQGLPTTRGHPALKDTLCAVTALPLRRLEAAGAVIFGKTNVPVDLADWQSYNPVYGATSNPWNPAHTPGGSSGGSVAALAAGLTGLEIGTDIGGSIRVPAHFCGVFGHKPTHGLVANYADPKTSAAAGLDIAVAGPLARSTADLSASLDALAGPDPDETGMTFNLPGPDFASLKDLRVAVWAEQPGQTTDSETVVAINALADRLEGEGVSVDRAARPDFNVTRAYHLYLQLLDAAWSIRQSEAIVAARVARKADLDPADLSADSVMLRMAGAPHRSWLMLNELRFKFRRLWSAFFRQYHVLLCPAFGTAALPHRQDGEPWERKITIDGRTIAYNDLLFWPGITCGFHLPASVVPVGATAGGLPIGVQIAGPVFGDRATLAAAALLEAAGYVFKAPPGW